MRKPRRVSRKLVATLFGPLRELVQITTLPGDLVGSFQIPNGKDPGEYLKHYGWTYIGRNGSGEDTFGKYVNL